MGRRGTLGDTLVACHPVREDSVGEDSIADDDQLIVTDRARKGCKVCADRRNAGIRWLQGGMAEYRH